MPLRLGHDYTIEQIAGYLFVTILAEFEFIIQWGFYSTDDRYRQEEPKHGYRVYFARDRQTKGRQVFETVYPYSGQAIQGAIDYACSIKSAKEIDKLDERESE